VIQTAIEKNPHYEYLGKVEVHDGYGKGAYLLWMNRSAAVGR
jgi:hypothetical protein